MSEAMGAEADVTVIHARMRRRLATNSSAASENGGAVHVVVVADEAGAKTLGFVYPEGPVLPRPERDIIKAGKKRSPTDGDTRTRKGGGTRTRKAGRPSAEARRPRSVPGRAAVRLTL